MAQRCDDVAKPKPRRGDVVHVEVGEPTDPVKIRLHGHPFTYLVKVAIKEAGPELAELTIIADDGHAVDYEALRAVPARALGYAAAQHLHPGPPKLAGRRWRSRGATFSHEGHKPPDMRVLRAVMLAERAQALGQPIRATVAEQLQVSKRTVDRLLSKAKAEGLIEDRSLPKRPPPRQRDRTE